VMAHVGSGVGEGWCGVTITSNTFVEDPIKT
jgi:hypothetical protein